MEKFEELKTLITSIEEDAVKFYEKGNKAAGTRARKALQEIRNLAKDIRSEISESKKQKTA